MTLRRGRRYRVMVVFPRDGTARRLVAGAVFLMSVLVAPLAASATSNTFEVGEQAVVQVWAGNKGEITVKGWDRPVVSLESDDDSMQVTRRQVAFGTPQEPLTASIPLQTIKIRDANGNTTDGTLPPEDFPYARMRSGLHDDIRIVAGAGAHVTVLVPQTTAILDIRFGVGGRLQGRIAVSDYHGGTLFALAGGGVATFDNVSTSAFIQVLNGRVIATDSTFERLRARSNTSALVFERCRARQIELSTVSGPIVYDNGTFDPGLARLITARGPIAVGVATNAQLSARTVNGRVVGLFDKRTPVDQRGDNEAVAMVGGGGPVVNVLSTNGNVLLYDGSLAARRSIPPEWRELQTALTRIAPGEAASAPNAGTFTPLARPAIQPRYDTEPVIPRRQREIRRV